MRSQAASYPPEIGWAVAQLRAHTRSDELVVSDLPIVPYLAGRQMPGQLIDTSIGRIALRGSAATCRAQADRRVARQSGDHRTDVPDEARDRRPESAAGSRDACTSRSRSAATSTSFSTGASVRAGDRSQSSCAERCHHQFPPRGCLERKGPRGCGRHHGRGPRRRRRPRRARRTPRDSERGLAGRAAGRLEHRLGGRTLRGLRAVRGRRVDGAPGLAAAAARTRRGRRDPGRPTRRAAAPLEGRLPLLGRGTRGDGAPREPVQVDPGRLSDRPGVQPRLRVVARGADAVRPGLGGGRHGSRCGRGHVGASRRARVSPARSTCTPGRDRARRACAHGTPPPSRSSAGARSLRFISPEAVTATR